MNNGMLPAPRSRGLARRGADQFLQQREASILLVAVALVVYFQARTPIFLTQDNLVTISQYVAATAIIAVGQVLLLVSGEDRKSVV